MGKAVQPPRHPIADIRTARGSIRRRVAVPCTVITAFAIAGAKSPGVVKPTISMSWPELRFPLTFELLTKTRRPLVAFSTKKLAALGIKTIYDCEEGVQIARSSRHTFKTSLTRSPGIGVRRLRRSCRFVRWTPCTAGPRRSGSGGKSWRCAA